MQEGIDFLKFAYTLVNVPNMDKECSKLWVYKIPKIY